MSFCSELNAKLDTIISQLGDLAACCQSGEVIYGAPPDRDLDVGDVPQAVIDAGYATDASDWAGYHDYKCMAAHILVENLKATVDSWASLVETSGITVVKVAGVLASAWFAWITGGASIVILGKFVVSDFIVWEALEALGSWAASDLHDLVGDIEAIRDDLVCAALNADGLYAIKSDVDDVLDANLSATAATLVKLANTQTKINAFFAPVYGDIDVAAWLADYGVDTGDYDCSCQGEILGKVLAVTNFPGLSVGDYVHHNDELSYSANQPTENPASLVIGDDTSGQWDIEGKKLRFTLISQTGWTNSTNDDKRGYNETSAPPYYWQSEAVEWNWSTTPQVIYSSHVKVGFQLQSNTQWSGVVRVELIDDV